MEGTASHQMTRGPSKTSGALIKVAVYLDVTKAMTLVASFMITGKFIEVKGRGRSRRSGVGGGVVEFSKVPV